VKLPRGLAVFVGSLALVGCERHSPTWDEPPDPSAVSSAQAAPPPASVASPASPAKAEEPRLALAHSVAPATTRGCRVVRLVGDATIRVPELPARPLVQGDLLAPRARIELASGAEVTVQSTVSTREIALEGPAVAEACPLGEEEVRLSRGKVKGFPGMGVRPGTDVWIATPLGVVRFNDAKLTIEVSGAAANKLEVSLLAGQARFVPALSSEDGGAPNDVSIRAGVPFVVERAGRARIADMVSVCTSQSESAERAARAVVAPAGDASMTALGDRAFAEVRAKQRARASCGSAWAELGLDPSDRDSSISARLTLAEQKWKHPRLTANESP
jgi:hypothetical protein